MLKKSQIKKLYIYLIIASIFWIFIFLEIPDRKFHIYFLDIGQGDAVFIKTPQNHQILIDGGPQNNVIQELSDIIPFFDRSIDLVVLTHPHADHVDGLVEVLKRYKVQNVLHTGVNYKNSSYQEFLSEIQKQKIKTYIADDKNDFILGDVKIDVIYPFEIISGKSFKNINNASIAVIISHKTQKILLTGDLEEEVESELIKTDLNLESNILKSPHHGSRTGSSMIFLNRVKPQKVVIQCGQDNSFKHPHPESIRNYHRSSVKEIYRNDLDGRVEFTW